MKIQPINLDVTPKIGTKIRITPIIRTTEDLTCTIQYSIYSDEGKALKVGSFELTEEEYSGWSNDNSYIDNIVLSRLGLNKLTE